MDCSKITIYKKIKKIIEKVSKKYDGEWIKRKRKIDSKFLIDFIFQLVTHLTQKIVEIRNL